MSPLGEGEAEGLADAEAGQVRVGARVRARRDGRGEGEDEEEGARPRHAEELRFGMVTARSQREGGASRMAVARSQGLDVVLAVRCCSAARSTT